MRLIGVGLLLILAGFGFAVVFVNIPYQDPTPEMQSRWERDLLIAQALMLIGLGVSIAGLAGVLWRRLRATR